MSPIHLPVRLSVLTLAVGLAVSWGAWAAEPVLKATEGQAEGKEADIRPKLKPSIKHDERADSKLAAKGEDKAARKEEGKGEVKPEGKAKPEPETKTEAKAEPKLENKTRPPVGGSTSMAELRDMIDQKIADVRSRQAAAPVVRLAVHAPKAPKREPLSTAGLAMQGHDAHGADAAHGSPLLGHEVHWSYSGEGGPEAWAKLKPEYQQCAAGKRQSPIDIRDGIPVQLDPIQFDYRPSHFRVLDNGHTVQVNVEPGNSITVQGHRFELLQFHFHRPSEERINGRQYEMVAHLVHKDSEGKLAVVAVLMDQGKSHPLVQMVWNNLPLEKEMEQVALSEMDLSALLPEQRQYYTYMGSLTTPPCSEGVLWMVMKQPATLSREQAGVFARLYPMNARPVQSASGRLIKDGQ